MRFAVQYLEGGAHTHQISPTEARSRLRAALERLPFEMVVLGWNLPISLVEACAEECTRAGVQLYLWQPLLTSDGRFHPRPEWQTIGLEGEPIAGFGGLAEFTFICPNHPTAQEAIWRHLSQGLSPGYYQGIFLDRIRFPSPAANPSHNLACFCQYCQQAAGQVGLDLPSIQQQLRQLFNTPEGQKTAVRFLLSAPNVPKNSPLLHALNQLLAFRRYSITQCVKKAADLAHRQGLQVGLDCFSPTLTRMVGQDLKALSPYCEWIKVMTYARAFGPATIPFEMSGLAEWLMSTAGLSEKAALSWLADASQWSLPDNFAALRQGRLPATILTAEIERGRAAQPPQLWAGMELVEMPGVAELNLTQIKTDLAALQAADGLVLSWDLWHIPLERLELVQSTK